METHRVCIDTDVIIDFLRQKSPGQDILEECIAQIDSLPDQVPFFMS